MKREILQNLKIVNFSMLLKFWGIQTLVVINFKKKKRNIFLIFDTCIPEKVFIWFSIHTALLHMSVVIRPSLCLSVLHLCNVNFFFMITGSMNNFCVLSHIKGKDNSSMFHYIPLLTTRGKTTDCIKVNNLYMIDF